MVSWLSVSFFTFAALSVSFVILIAERCVGATKEREKIEQKNRISFFMVSPFNTLFLTSLVKPASLPARPSPEFIEGSKDAGFRPLVTGY